MKKLLITLLMLTLTVPAFAGAKMRADYTDHLSDAEFAYTMNKNTDDVVLDDGPSGRQSNGQTGTWTASCQVGGCIELDGTGQRILPNDHLATVGALSEGTIVAWVNVDDTTNEPIVSISDQSTNNNFFDFAIVSDDLYVLAKTSTDVIRAQTTSTIGSLDTWTHVAYTTQSGENTFYVNGSSVAVTYASGSSSTQAFFSHAYNVSNNDAFIVGKAVVLAATNNFNGHIDEFAILPYKTAAQIQDIYTNGLK